MTYGNNPTYTQTNAPVYTGMHPNLDQQQVQYYHTNPTQPFYNPVLTVTQPNNYQPTQTNYQYPASPSPQVLPNLSLYTNPASPMPPQPLQTNYTVTTYTTLPAYPPSLPSPLPAQPTQPIMYPPLSPTAPQPLPPSTATLTVQQTQLPPYPSSAPTLYPIINSSRKIDIPSNLPFDQTVQKSEELILAQIQSLKSTFPSSHNWYSYETQLRETVAKEIINKFASQYRAKFNEAGAFDLNQIKINSSVLKGLLTANDHIYSLLDLNKLLLQEIFELGSENMPFEAVRKKIIEEVAIPQSEKKSSFLDVFKTKAVKEKAALKEAAAREKANLELKNKKLEAIDLAEKEWNALNYVSFVDLSKTIPTAPAVTPPLYPQLPQATIATPPSAPLPLYGAPIIEDSQPAPIQPAQPTTGKKYSVNNPDVPVLSYIDLAFANVTWNNLPENIRRDAVLHMYGFPGIKGKAEEAAKAVYKNEDLWTVYQQAKNNRGRALSYDQFSIEGQKLLDFYYSDDFSWSDCLERFRALPKDNTRFYQYVYEMAKAANVDIPGWDHDFAKNNWDKPGIRKLSIQALERCLHTSPKG